MSGVNGILMRFRARFHCRRVLVPRDGQPLTDAEARAFTDAMRGWAMRTDRELARFERDIETYMQEMREEGAAG